MNRSFLEPEVWGTGFLILAGVVILSLIGIMGYENYQFQQIPPTRHECRLISGSFSPSTSETHVVPVVTTKGMGMGLTSSGNPERRTTIWECSGVGRVLTDKKDVYRFAKDVSTLILRVGEVDVEVLGIEHE